MVLSSYLTSGPSSQVVRQAGWYWWNHGAPHWVLLHQCRGDNILLGQDYIEDDEREENHEKKTHSCETQFWYIDVLSLIYLIIFGLINWNITENFFTFPLFHWHCMKLNWNICLSEETNVQYIYVNMYISLVEIWN